MGGIDFFLENLPGELRDRVVIVIQSEMARTPWHNVRAGKDHWAINSMMMMMRKGIRGNRVIGKTKVDPETGKEQSASNIDPNSLDISEAGIRLRPEHLQYALREFAGIENHLFSKRFDLKVAESERLQNLF